MDTSRGTFRTMKLMQTLFKIIALSVLLAGQAFAASDFLPPEKAFRIEAAWLENSNQIEVELSPVTVSYTHLTLPTKRIV